MTGNIDLACYYRQHDDSHSLICEEALNIKTSQSLPVIPK